MEVSLANCAPKIDLINFNGGKLHLKIAIGDQWPASKVSLTRLSVGKTERSGGLKRLENSCGL